VGVLGAESQGLLDQLGRRKRAGSPWVGGGPGLAVGAELEQEVADGSGAELKARGQASGGRPRQVGAPEGDSDRVRDGHGSTREGQAIFS
jgi:hypothetical protein